MLAANGLYCPRFVLDLKPAPARQNGAQRAIFAGKVHKPPLGFNANKFELNGSLGVPQTPKSCDTPIKILS